MAMETTDKMPYCHNCKHYYSDPVEPRCLKGNSKWGYLKMMPCFVQKDPKAKIIRVVNNDVIKTPRRVRSRLSRSYEKIVKKVSPTNEQGLRVCNVCGEAKTLEHFYPRKDVPSGYSNFCRECHHIYLKEYKKKHPKVKRAENGNQG